MLPIAILANNSKIQKIVVEGSELWAMNVRAMEKKRVDVVIDIHPIEYLARTNGQEYLDWLASLHTVYMQDKYFPNVTVYPFEEVFELTKNIHFRGKKLEFLSYTISYIIALAVLKSPPKISLYGFELREEYEQQKNAFAFWTGFAGGRGIPLEINCADAIFDKPIYGQKVTPDVKETKE